MFIFWGTGRKKKDTKYSVNDLCGNCGTGAKMKVVQVYNYGHIFFIRIVKANTKYFVECPNCGAARQLTKAEFKSIKNQYILENGGTVKESPKKAEKSTKQPQAEKLTTQPVQTQPTPIVEQATVMEKLIWQDIDKVIFALVDKSTIQNSERFNKFLSTLQSSLIRKYGDEERVIKVINKYFDIK